MKHPRRRLPFASVSQGPLSLAQLSGQVGGQLAQAAIPRDPAGGQLRRAFIPPSPGGRTSEVTVWPGPAPPAACPWHVGVCLSAPRPRTRSVCASLSRSVPARAAAAGRGQGHSASFCRHRLLPATREVQAQDCHVHLGPGGWGGAHRPSTAVSRLLESTSECRGALENGSQKAVSCHLKCHENLSFNYSLKYGFLKEPGQRQDTCRYFFFSHTMKGPHGGGRTGQAWVGPALPLYPRVLGRPQAQATDSGAAISKGPGSLGD